MAAEVRPYIGPRPFSENDQKLFFGRTGEAQHVVSLLVAHPIVLLHARSGAGKSSLVNADVIPRLRNLGRDEAMLGEAHDDTGAEIIGPLRVGGELLSDAAEVANIFAHNALLSLDPPQSAASISAYLERLPHRPGTLPRIVVFDQFEELFTTFDDRWRDRGAFLDDLGEALESDRRLRVLLVMREEFLAGIDAFATRLPERARTRFRLEPLRRDAALLAVQKPLTHTGRTFDAGAAEKLVQNLLHVPVKTAAGPARLVESEFIEPLHLQVVCQNIWESLPADTTVITEDLISNYGDVDDALARHYERSISKAVEAGAREGELRRWFENTLITSKQTRGIAFRDRTSTAGLGNRFVDILEHAYLLRSELRGAMTWYELSHDRFVSPILLSNDLWRQKLEHGATTRARFEAHAAEWVSGGRRGRLLSAVELEELRAWQETPAATELGISAALTELANFSETSAARAAESASASEARKLRTQRAVIITLALLLASAAGWAAFQSKRAVLASAGAAAARQELAQRALAEDANRREVYAQQLLDQERNRSQQQSVLARAMDESARSTYGKVAVDLAAHEHEFHALALGIRAVARPLSEDAAAKNEEVLRTAARAVGDSLWLAAPEKQIRRTDLTANGKYAILLMDDRFLVWDTTSDTLLPPAEHPRDRRLDMVWILGGSPLAIARSQPMNDVGGFTGGDRFHYYHVATGRLNTALEEYGANVNAVNISPDGRWADFFFAEEQIVKRVDTRSGKVEPSEPLLGGAIDHTLDFSSDAKYALVVSEQATVTAQPAVDTTSTAGSDDWQEWLEEDDETDDGDEVEIEELAAEEPNELPVPAVDAEESRPVLPTTAVLLELETMTVRPIPFTCAAAPSYEADFAPDNRSAVIFQNDRAERIASFVSIPDGTALGPPQTIPLESIYLHNGREFLVMAESKIRVFDIASGEIVRQHDAPAGMTHLATKENGMMLFEHDAPPRHELIAWDAWRNTFVARLENLRTVYAADVDESGLRFLLTRGDGTSRLWDARRCPLQRGRGRVCSATNFADRTIEKQLHDRASLLGVACGQLRAKAADVYKEVKDLCEGK